MLGMRDVLRIDSSSAIGFSSLTAESHGNEFGITGRCEPVSEEAFFAFQGKAGAVPRPQGQRSREFVEAMMTRDLLEQVLFASDVHAMTRHFDRPPVACLARFEAQPLEDAFDNGVVNRRTQKCPYSVPAKRRHGGLRPAGIHVDDITIDLAVRKFTYECGRPVAGETRHFDISATLEPI